MDPKAKANNNAAGNNAGKQPNATHNRFQGQDQIEMKGIVINHSLDHKTPISQQFDTFYKAAKIAAGKMNPDLRKPMRTLKGLTEEDFTIAFPDAENRLWIEEQKGIKKRTKRYEEDLKKMFDIMHRHLSSGITEKLKAKDDWTLTEE
eukprot:jgi/Psemu1/40559/gm1.40559_g